MILQVGSITNIFGCCTDSAKNHPVAAVVVAAASTVTCVATVPVLLALTGVLFALASVLWSTAAVVAALGFTFGLPYAARQFRIGAEANRDTVYAMGALMGAAETAHRLQAQQAQALPPKPMFVASTVGNTEIKEISRGTR